jgi:hypothetical protein
MADTLRRLLRQLWDQAREALAPSPQPSRVFVPVSTSEPPRVTTRDS